jgi:hypothetical protein
VTTVKDENAMVDCRDAGNCRRQSRSLERRDSGRNPNDLEKFVSLLKCRSHFQCHRPSF